MQITNSKDFGKIIKFCRKRLKLTQEQVANYSNVGVRFIVDLEKGKPTCELNKALSVAKTLGAKVEIPFILGDE